MYVATYALSVVVHLVAEVNMKLMETRYRNILPSKTRLSIN